MDKRAAFAIGIIGALFFNVSQVISQPMTAPGLSVKVGLAGAVCTIGDNVDPNDFQAPPGVYTYDSKKPYWYGLPLINVQYQYKQVGIRWNPMHLTEYLWRDVAAIDFLYKRGQFFAFGDEMVLMQIPEWELWYSLKSKSNLTASFGLGKASFLTGASRAYFPIFQQGRTFGPLMHLRAESSNKSWASIQVYQSLFFSYGRENYYSGRNFPMRLPEYSLTLSPKEKSFRQLNMQFQGGKGRWFGTFEVRIVSHPLYEDSPTKFLLGGGYVIPIKLNFLKKRDQFGQPKEAPPRPIELNSI
jgi:hypothetical protein